MSSMSNIYIGVSGLSVSQAAINATAHNLANVDTKGFVRQQVVMSDSIYNNVGSTHFNTLQKGLGANVLSIRQVREIFLDQDYRREVGRKGFYQAGSQAVDEVQGLFGELEGVQFQTTINDIWYALQEVSKEPNSLAARSILVESAIALAERSEGIYQQVDAYQINLNEKISQHVKRINNIGDQINELNSKIIQYEVGGQEQANDYRDLRNNLLDELGEIVRIDYRENMEGSVDVSIEGVQFVSDGQAYHMGMKKVSDESEMLKPIWPFNGDVDVFNLNVIPQSSHNTDIGSLKGILFARGNGKTNYTDIPVREDFSNQDTFERAKQKYNQSVDSSVILTGLAQFDQLVHGIVTRINDVLSPNKEVTLLDGTKIKILDTENAPRGMDENQVQGEALFNRKSMARYQELTTITIINEDGNPEEIQARIYNEENKNDNYSLFTLGEIEVNQNIIENYSKLPLSSTSGTGEYDIKVAEELLSKWHEPFATLSPNTLTANNFNEYYTAFIGGIANRGERFSSIGENQESMVNSIDNQRVGVTGVSSDEELTSLIKYQHSYNAASRYVNVISDMLEHVILRLAS